MILNKITYRYLLSVVLTFFLLSGSGYSQKRIFQGKEDWDIKFLCVGSTDYPVNLKGIEHFPTIDAANKSAKGMYDVLKQMGASEGSILISNPTHLITQKDILAEIDTLVDSTDRQKWKRTLFIFYYCGHGATDGEIWKNYLIPGNYNCHLEGIGVDNYWDHVAKEYIPYKRVDFSECIDLGTILTKIEEKGIPHLVFIDACYEGMSNFFAQGRIPNKDDKKQFQLMAKNLTGYDRHPLIFSAFPSQSVTPVEDPAKSNSSKYVGPLYRRAKLVVNKLERKGKSNVLNDFLSHLMSPKLDRGTTVPSFTSVQMVADYKKIIFNKASKPFKANPIKYGSGEVCSPVLGIDCFNKDMDSLIKDLRNGIRLVECQIGGNENLFHTFLEFDSPRVGYGPKYWTPENSDIKLFQIDSSHIEFCFRTKEDTLRLVLAMEKSRKLTNGVNDYVFGTISDNYPCLAICANDNCCNEGPGEVTIEQVSFDNEGLIKDIAFTFKQTCTPPSSFTISGISGKMRFNSTTK